MKKKNVNKEKIVKEGKKVFTEFKEFIARGNVIDLAVGVIIGSAFGKIITSMVNDILMPMIGVIIGGINFSGLSLKIGNATVNYGMFVQNVIDFLIVAICIFFFVKIVERISRKKETEEIEEVKKDEQIVLLEQIRDLLKEVICVVPKKTMKRLVMWMPVTAFWMMAVSETKICIMRLPKPQNKTSRARE